MTEFDYSMFDDEVLKIIDRLSGYRADHNTAESVYSNSLNLDQDAKHQLFVLLACVAIPGNTIFREIRSYLNRRGM